MNFLKGENFFNISIVLICSFGLIALYFYFAFNNHVQNKLFDECLKSFASSNEKNIIPDDILSDIKKQCLLRIK